MTIWCTCQLSKSFWHHCRRLCSLYLVIWIFQFLRNKFLLISYFLLNKIIYSLFNFNFYSLIAYTVVVFFLATLFLLQVPSISISKGARSFPEILPHKQDTLLAQNMLIAKQIETLTETLNKLP